MHKHVLVVSESIFNVTVVKSNITAVILTISRGSKSHCIRHVYLRRCSLNELIRNARWSNFKCAISNLQIAHIWMSKSYTSNLRGGSTMDRSKLRIRDTCDLRVGVICKFDSTLRAFSSIKCDIDNIM
jgi:hypothetical protein